MTGRPRAVDAHPEQAAIDRQLDEGVPLDRIARDYAVSRATLSRRRAERLHAVEDGADLVDVRDLPLHLAPGWVNGLNGFDGPDWAATTRLFQTLLGGRHASATGHGAPLRAIISDDMVDDAEAEVARRHPGWRLDGTGSPLQRLAEHCKVRQLLERRRARERQAELDRIARRRAETAGDIAADTAMNNARAARVFDAGRPE